VSIQVSALWTYPVKSMAGVSQLTVDVNDWGPVGDRRWMLVDDSNCFLTQRQLPRMCRFGAEALEDGLRLWNLDKPEDSVDVVFSLMREYCHVQVWSDISLAQDAGDEAAGWLSGQFGQSVRLCYMTDDTFRQVDLAYARQGDRVGFADGFPFLLCNEASLAALCTSLGRDIAMLRFRPNIVVSGAPPFAEDNWRGIRIAGIAFELLKPCARCAIPTINPLDASREADVYKVLKAERQRDGQVFFGQNMLHRGQGGITVGDNVTLLD
jgi:uncharacterized protein YcbX